MILNYQYNQYVPVYFIEAKSTPSFMFWKSAKKSKSQFCKAAFYMYMYMVEHDIM